MYQILITDKLPDSAVNILKQNSNYNVTESLNISPEVLKKEIAGYHALIVRSATTVTSEIIEAGKNLKVIGRAGSGLDNIDVSAAKKKNIEVLNTPGSNSQAVAELTISMMFALSRNLYTAFKSLKEGRWEKSKLGGSEIMGKTLGLIGFGQIGQKVGKMADGLDMRVLVYKRSPVRRSPGFPYELVELDFLLAKSDYVSLHLPKNEQSVNLFDLNTMRKMKKEAFLINCARGGIVNENDLLSAMEKDILAGAAIDVFDTEPPKDFSLVNHAKVIATPHIGASTKESQERVGLDIVNSVMHFLETKYLFISGKKSG